MGSSHKDAKEAFVSGHTGGSVWDAQTVIAMCATGYLLYRCLTFTSRLPMDQSNQRSFWSTFTRTLLESMLLVLPELSVMTVADAPMNSLALIAFLVVAAAVSLAAPSRPLAHVFWSQTVPSSPTPSSALNFRPFSLVFRSYLQLVTVIAILAVDFHVFPRRFAKTETFGYSLMDLGVGGFIFSNGFVAGPRLKNSTPRSLDALFKSIRIALPILVIGFIRLGLTKGLEYQEHVTEYGVHWNFFFTLSLIPILTSIMQYLIPNLHFGAVSAILLAAYQYTLSTTGLEEYILTSPRVRGDLFSMNREGICSFLGYAGIFFAAACLGERILTSDERLLKAEEKELKMARDLKQARKQTKTKRDVSAGKVHTDEQIQESGGPAFSLDMINIIDLGTWLSASTTLFLAVRYERGILVSRRLANLPYSLWVIAVSVSLLFALLIIDKTFAWFLPTEAQIIAAHPLNVAATIAHASESNRPNSRGRSRSSSRKRNPSRSRSSSATAKQKQKKGKTNLVLPVLDLSENERLAFKMFLHRTRTPLILECVNRNQLAVFLLANLLTGLVNLTINTLEVPPFESFAILILYVTVVIGAAVAWDAMDLTLNLNRVQFGGSSRKGTPKEGRSRVKRE
ncbi:Glucosaminyl phosphatidylinositol (GlcN-PI) nositol acylation protein [Chytriomyces hyalinus]|nr:Glucosaminyl phosphatidylinositol (GlcN-PI) nositol acylation protein [Chytriomyces hyalinus]